MKLKTDPGGLISDAAGYVTAKIDGEIVAAGGTILENQSGIFTPAVAGYSDMPFTAQLAFDVATLVFGVTKVSKVRSAAGLFDELAAEGAAPVARTYGGGAYGRLSSEAGVIERHHAPPNSLNFTTEYSGPAIQMDYADHLLTSSHTRAGLDGKLYRAEIQGLIESGNMRGAMAREIWDIRRAAVQGGGLATKYNAAMREMLDYTYSKGWISK